MLWCQGAQNTGLSNHKLKSGTGKDGWEKVDMLWCQGAQNTGLSNHKLKSVLTCTI